MHRSGNYRWVEDRVVPLKDDDGRVIEWVGVITDIHERVVADQAESYRTELLEVIVIVLIVLEILLAIFHH